MITATGLRMVQEIITSGDHAHITHLGLGSGTAVPTINDSGLQYETASREAVSYTALGSPSVGDTFYVTWNSVEASGVGSISEFGLFSQSTTGSMFCRASSNTISFTGGSEYKFEWDIQTV